jgi:hypothetical protein
MPEAVPCAFGREALDCLTAPNRSAQAAPPPLVSEQCVPQLAPLEVTAPLPWFVLPAPAMAPLEQYLPSFYQWLRHYPIKSR